MLVHLTTIPTVLESEFFDSLLTDSDTLLVSNSALSLAFCKKPFNAICVLKDEDAARIGGSVHPDWNCVSSEQWLNLHLTEKTLTW